MRPEGVAAPNSPDLKSKCEVCSRQRVVQSDELDLDVGNAVAIDIALDKGRTAGLIIAQLSSHAGEGRAKRRQQGKGLVAASACIRVDAGEIDLIRLRATMREVDDD